MKMIVFGTRPEIIKLYPIIKRMPDAYLVWTGQHDTLATQMLKDFQITPNENLDVMVEGQSLSNLTIKLHQKLSEVYERLKPTMVIVQGDTTSAIVASLEAFYHKIPVVHIEAGLRTNDIYSPFPEEVNRRIITQIAKYHFTPTFEATENAMLQSHKNSYVYKVGQTGIDTLLEVEKDIIVEKKDQILVTLHRRENYDKFDKILDKISYFLAFHPDWEVVMPVHPGVRKIIEALEPPFRLIEPLGYFDMISVMKQSRLIITDSGGIQEEASALKIPVYVARNITERPEGVVAGFARLLTDKIELFDVPNKPNPYGDGKAAERIIKCLS